MPTTNFSLGKDATLVVIAPTGQRVDLSIVTNFESKQNIKQVHVAPLNGPPIEAHLPGGWSGSFSMDRGSSAADDMASQIEAGFWAGGTVGLGQIYHYVAEKDGSQSTYLYDGVAMHLANAGSWKQDSAVPQTVQFFASTRRRI